MMTNFIFWVNNPFLIFKMENVTLQRKKGTIHPFERDIFVPYLPLQCAYWGKFAQRQKTVVCPVFESLIMLHSHIFYLFKGGLTTSELILIHFRGLQPHFW